jgi:glutamine synthetase
MPRPGEGPMEKAKDFNEELNVLLKETITNHKRILFSGNNYSSEWEKEAKRRGLSNYKTTFDALPHYTDEKNIELFERHNILSEQEIHSRMEILLENYCNIIRIEALTAIDMARKEITPAVIDYQKFLLDELKLKKEFGDIPCGLEENLLKEFSYLAENFHLALNKLILDEKKFKASWTNFNKAKYCKNTLLKDMETVRKYADEMELLIGKDFSAFPSYEDILYSVKY